MEQSVKTINGNETQIWRLPNGKLHREDGPAIIWPSGTQVWYQYDKLHRDDGPARIEIDGTKGYWLNGTELTEGSLNLKLIQERERRRETSCGTTG